MHLARYYLERLVFGVTNFKSNQELIPEVVLRKFFEFPELELKFPSEICDLTDIEQGKILFRLANT